MAGTFRLFIPLTSVRINQSVGQVQCGQDLLRIPDTATLTLIDFSEPFDGFHDSFAEFHWFDGRKERLQGIVVSL